MKLLKPMQHYILTISKFFEGIFIWEGNRDPLRKDCPYNAELCRKCLTENY
jgi:hypothetical protein